jgi:hypothetical protein
MKLISSRIAGHAVCAFLAICILTGCKKIAGLPLQENTDHVSTTIDPHINETAWQFLKDRALGTSNFKDSIFYQMYLAIMYSGIDTAEYTTAGRTYIFLHNDAVNRKSNGVTQADSYFGKYKVGGVAATSWDQYPQEQVKNYLLSLIVDGEFTFENVGPDPSYEKSLMPPGTDSLNPESAIVFSVINDRNSRFTINGFPGSAFPAPNLAAPGLAARTGGILSTNGPIHVIDRVLFYQTQ